MSDHQEMSCKELVGVITDYLDGTLPAPDRARFDAHLEECPYCVSYLGQMRDTIEALGELREQSLSPEAREGLLEAFRGRRGAA
jgi:anti-sigma factor RsiW